MLKNVMDLAARTKSHLTLVASAAVLSCGLVTSAQALQFNQISQVYFFGDSLTDSGFYDELTNPGVKSATFTTPGGYIWSQYIAHDIKGHVLPPAGTEDSMTNNAIYFGAGKPLISGTQHGFDYAAGGSTTNSTGNPPSIPTINAPSLVSQVNYFLSTTPQPLDPNAVFFIWSGANDILILLNGPTPTELQLLQAANTAAINIANQVAKLSAHGAKRIVIVSLPNIGITPAIALQHNPLLQASLKTVSFTFNSMLNQQVGKVISQYHTKVLYTDSYKLLDDVVLDTQAGKPYVVLGQPFQFLNYTTPECGATSSLTCTPADLPPSPYGYVFADTVHPTDMAHRLLSLVIESEILAWS